MHSERVLTCYELPSAVSEHAAQQFQEARRTENERDGKIKTDDFVFHRYLNLARYMSIGKMGSLQLRLLHVRQLKRKEIKKGKKEYEGNKTHPAKPAKSAEPAKPREKPRGGQGH